MQRKGFWKRIWIRRKVYLQTTFSRFLFFRLVVFESHKFKFFLNPICENVGDKTENVGKSFSSRLHVELLISFQFSI